MYLDMFADFFGQAIRYAPHIEAWRETLLGHPAIASAIARTLEAGQAWQSQKLTE